MAELKVNIEMSSNVGPRSGSMPEYKLDELQRQDDARMAHLDEACRRELEARRAAMKLSKEEMLERQLKVRSRQHVAEANRKRAKRNLELAK